MIAVQVTHGYNALPFSPWMNAAVIDPIENRIAEFRQQDRMKTGSLIVSIFGDAILPRGGRVWLGSLIRLLEPLQLNERLIRTSIFRLVKEGWLQSEALGRRAECFAVDVSKSEAVTSAVSQIEAAFGGEVRTGGD